MCAELVILPLGARKNKQKTKRCGYTQLFTGEYYALSIHPKKIGEKCCKTELETLQYEQSGVILESMKISHSQFKSFSSQQDSHDQLYPDYGNAEHTVW